MDEVARVEKSALISPCGKYRYRLGRRWSPEPCVLWIMLNPSTADASIDDRTICRCMGYAMDWGYGGILVGNIFPYRTTYPKELLGDHDIHGVGNWLHIREMSKESALAVCGWGANKLVSWAEPGNVHNNVIKQPIKCLGKTKSGAPLHPLYQPADAVLIDYP